MLAKSHLKAFIRGKCHTILKQLQRFADCGEGSALHKLRVAVKKLRAVEEFLDTQHQLGKKRPTRSLKRVFKHAGRIRSAQLHLDQLKKLPRPMKRMEEEQRQIISGESLSFHEAKADYKRRIRKACRRLKKHVSSVSCESVQTYFQEHLQSLHTYFSALPLEESELHTKRKDLKKLIYLYSILPASLKATVPLDVAHADEIQEAIGDWHDAVDSLKSLNENKAPNAAISSAQRQKKRALAIVMKTARNFPSRKPS